MSGFKGSVLITEKFQSHISLKTLLLRDPRRLGAVKEGGV